MTRARKVLFLTISAIPVTFALAEGLLPGSTARLQAEYEREQASIDLTINKLKLDAARGTITAEEAQDGIDLWIRSNTARLQAQARLAARLDQLDPLPASADAPWPAAEAVLPGDHPQAARHAALAAQWDLKMEQLRTQAQSAEQFQDLVDIWIQSPEGMALRREKGEIEQAEARRHPLGTQPVVLEAGETAPAAEVAALEFQEKVARRIMDIRAENPDADAEQMQDLIDGRMEEFRKDFAEINRLLGQASREVLEAEVARLEQAAAGENAAGSGQDGR